MSYTNTSVTWEKCSQEPIENIYGDIQRNAPIAIKARKQPHQEVVKTSEGREVLSKTIYYVDPKIEPNALAISRMDKLDGETIEQKYVMCDLQNRPRMVRFITV